MSEDHKGSPAPEAGADVKAEQQAEGGHDRSRLGPVACRRRVGCQRLTEASRMMSQTTQPTVQRRQTRRWNQQQQ